RRGRSAFGSVGAPFARRSRTRPRPVPAGEGVSVRLCLYDVGAGDLVVPALLLRIEGCPDHADEEREARDEQADVPEERADQIELSAVRLDHADVERAHPD